MAIDCVDVPQDERVRPQPENSYETTMSTRKRLKLSLNGRSEDSKLSRIEEGTKTFKIIRDLWVVSFLKE